MSDTPRTNQWIKMYGIDCNTAVQALPMQMEYDLADKDKIISDMGKRFDKLGSELAALKATCEDYRIQACRPDDCRIMDRLRKANAKLDVAVGALKALRPALFAVSALEKIDAIERGA
jgi:hypothetical protein